MRLNSLFHTLQSLPTIPTIGLILGLANISLGCAETVCPKGSQEVEGSCKAVEAEAHAATQGDGSTSEVEGNEGNEGNDASACGDEAVEGECGAPNPCALDAEGHTVCAPHASCTPVGGEAVCSCDQGYEGDGKTCTRNPCVALEEESAPCGAHTSCQAEDDTMLECVCDAGFADCDGNAETGCEVSTADDAKHCGACGFSCAPGVACAEGLCQPTYSQIALGVAGSGQCNQRADGAVYCWGAAGFSLDADLTIPTQIVAASGGSSLSVGYSSACTIASGSDELVCWGQNPAAILGAPDTGAKTVRQTVPGITGLSVQLSYACAVAKGNVYCWGAGSSSQLGDGFSYTSPNAFRGFNADRPVITGRSLALTGVVQVSTALSQGCARLQTGGVQCWGSAYGTSFLAEDVKGDTSAGFHGSLSDATYLCSGLLYSCALRADATAVCWGMDPTTYAQNPNATTPRNGFREVALDNVVSLSCGSAHACAINDKGDLYCWGSNANGQLGIGSTDAVRAAPSKVQGLSDVAAVYTGVGSCARLRDGRHYCWGSATDREISPVAVTGWP